MINHRESLGKHMLPRSDLTNLYHAPPQLAALGVEPSHAIISHDDTSKYLGKLIPVMQPFGQVAALVSKLEYIPIDDMTAFFKSLTFHWERMFTKPMYGYRLESQGLILSKLAQLAEDGTLPSIVTVRKELSLATLREGHDLQASGKVYGKIAFNVPDKWE